MNNVFVVGETQEGEDKDDDLLIIKYNSNGDLLGKKTWDHNGNETGSEIVINSQDEIFVAGRADSFFSSDYDLFILKIDPIFASEQSLVIIIIIISIVGSAAVIGLVIFLLRKRRKRYK